MTKSARAIALDLLRRVQHGAFSTPLVTAAHKRYALSKQDKGFLSDLVYGTLRQQIFLDACLEPYLKAPHKLPEDIRLILRLGAYEKVCRQSAIHAVVNEWVSISKKDSKNRRLSGLVNAVLRKVNQPEHMPPAKRLSVPDWLYADWRSFFGKELSETIATGMLEAEPLWLQSYHPEAKASLERQGCSVSTPFFADSLAVQTPVALEQLEAFQQGWLQPQNASSSLAARLFDNVKGQRVLDLCSGNGIKAAQLAHAGAEVFSVELQEKKLERASHNLARLGFSLPSLAWDLRTKPAIDAANYVLLDAPCSGTGTLRGNPEIRGRIEEEEVQQLAELQLELLDTAAQLTLAGGTLIYAICSLARAESITVIEKFLAKHTDFHVTDFHVEALHIENFTSPLPHHQHEYGTFILPVQGLDGFFISKLQKNPTPE